MTAPEEDVQLILIDGREALMIVLARPGSDDEHIAVEAHCNGLGKHRAAQILRRMAAQWEAEA